MSIGTWGKRVTLLSLLIAVHVIFGLACQRLQIYSALLLENWRSFILPAIWVFVPLFLVMVVAGLVVCLIRPYRVVALAFALSSFMMMILWGLNRYILLAGVVYWLIGSIYAFFAIRSLDNSIRFSLRPVIRSQAILAFAMILLMSFSFTISYSKSMADSGSVVPPGLKQALTDLSIRSFENRLDNQGVNNQSKALALEEGRHGLDILWSGLENTLAPFSAFIPLVAGMAVMVVLYIVFLCFAWFPGIILEFLFLILFKLKYIHLIPEMKQIQRVGLG